MLLLAQEDIYKWTFYGSFIHSLFGANSGILSPEYEQMKRVGNKLLLSFRYAENGLSTPTGKLTLFEVAGADKVFYPATAKIVNNRSKIEVYSDKVIEPVAVRYAFRNFVVGELFGNSGLPVSSFRTDDWSFAK